MSKEKNNKPNCYECKWRNDIAGSAHSCCQLPAIASLLNDPMLTMLSLFASVGRTPPMVLDALGVTGKEHGIKKGWFNWPWNYDPVWLESCDGFQKKGGESDAESEEHADNAQLQRTQSRRNASKQVGRDTMSYPGQRHQAED